MKHRSRFLKIAAVGSSLLLVAVYVSCQANQHDPDPVPPDTQPQPATEKTLLPGSKSAEIFPSQPPPQTMGGSKSRAVVTPDDLVVPRVTPGQPPRQTRSPR